MNSDTSLLSVSHLSLSTAGRTPLVHGIHFTVERGEMVALVGESGSGKTLSSLAVLGLLPEGVRGRQVANAFRIRHTRNALAC